MTQRVLNTIRSPILPDPFNANLNDDMMLLRILPAAKAQDKGAAPSAGLTMSIQPVLKASLVCDKEYYAAAPVPTPTRQTPRRAAEIRVAVVRLWTHSLKRQVGFLRPSVR